MKGREKCCVWSVLGPRDEWSTVEKEEAGLKVMTKLVVEKFKLMGILYVSLSARNLWFSMVNFLIICHITAK